MMKAFLALLVEAEELKDDAAAREAMRAAEKKSILRMGILMGDAGLYTFKHNLPFPSNCHSIYLIWNNEFT